MNLDIGLNPEYKPGSVRDIKRRMLRGIRTLMTDGVHPDEMSTPSQTFLFENGLITSKTPPRN